MHRVNRRSIAFQLNLALATAVVVVLAALVVFASGFTQRQMLDGTRTELQRQVGVLDRMLEFYYDVLENRANEYARIFAGFFDTTLSLDGDATVAVGDYAAPVIRAGERALNLNYDEVDAFAERTGGNATVFVRYRDDFLRVTTSLRKPDGSRATGTLLGKNQVPSRSVWVPGCEGG
ncbi:Cache 3/Cache 2 fusion domain-containing protein [Arhodomonas sp. AD133]|uniref:Cache 3/Cache 2 fusion domain-containing protein n=1 Tax=Arhodomonas sp. AD133 TaxID=3415009 RepID=UPI003EBEDFFE